METSSPVTFFGDKNNTLIKQIFEKFTLIQILVFVDLLIYHFWIIHVIILILKITHQLIVSLFQINQFLHFCFVRFLLFLLLVYFFQFSIQKFIQTHFGCYSQKFWNLLFHLILKLSFSFLLITNLQQFTQSLVSLVSILYSILLVHFFQIFFFCLFQLTHQFFQLLIV